MGDKKAEKKSVIDMLDESIMAIERRQGYLKAKLNLEPDDKAREAINQELTILDQQWSYTMDARNTVEIELKKEKNLEDKKRIENMIKGSMLIGMMREKVRFSMERDLKWDKDREAVQTAQFERAVEKVFNTMELEFVTKDMVEEIMNNQEFAEMEQTGDVGKLEREADDMKAQYEDAMDSVLRLDASEDLTADFETKKRRFTQKMNKERYYHTVAEEMRLMMNSDFFKKCATAEDMKFYDELYEDVLEVTNETERLYTEMSLGNNSFEKGNGFSKALIEKEQDIMNRLNDYNNLKLLPRVEKGFVDNDPNSEDVAKMYAASLKFVHPLAVQNKADKKNFENNELRKKMEMWQVYQRLPKGTTISKKQLKKAVDDEFRCWDKIERMRRTGNERGGIERSINEWAADSALYAFKVAKNIRDSERDKNIANNQKLKVTPQQKKDIKLCIAKIVLKNVIEIEMKRGLKGDQSHYKELVEFKKSKGDDKYNEALMGKFNEMAEKLANDPDFTKSLEKNLGGKGYSDKVIKFISQDMDQKIAKDLAKRAPAVKNEAAKPEEKMELKKEPAAMVLTPNNNY